MMVSQDHKQGLLLRSRAAAGWQGDGGIPNDSSGTFPCGTNATTASNSVLRVDITLEDLHHGAERETCNRIPYSHPSASS